MNILLRESRIRLESAGRLRRLVLTNDQCLNALDAEFNDQMMRVLEYLETDPEFRVGVLTAEGRGFCSGMNLRMYADDAADIGFYRQWEEVVDRLSRVEAMMIAGIHGCCVGGGLHLALACDIRAATPDCRMSVTGATRASLLPGLWSIWHLPRIIGMGRARRLILTGETFTGEDAAAMGLVDHLAPEEELPALVDGISAECLGNASLGVRLTKRAMVEAAAQSRGEALSAYLDMQARILKSADAAEARASLREKRPPRWG